MEYKYYLQRPDGFVIKKQTASYYFCIIICALISMVGVYYSIKSGKNEGYWLGLTCMFLVAILIYSRKMVNVTIQPSQKKVIVKKMYKVKEYSFNNFLNFHTTIVRTNGLVAQRQVSMYFDEGGKNRNIFLRVVFGKKAELRLIDETKDIMERNNLGTTH